MDLWTTQGRCPQPHSRHISRSGHMIRYKGRTSLRVTDNKCPGSAHVRRAGVSFAAFGEILGWGEIAKRLVGSDVVEVMGEAIDLGLEWNEVGWQFVAGVELVSPG